MKNKKNNVKRRLLASKENKKFVLKLEDIVLFFAHKKLAVAVDRSNHQYVCDDNLKDIQSILDERFFRANRQYIINADHLLSYEAHGRVKLRLQMNLPLNGHDILVSQETAIKFREWVSNL